MKCEFCRCLPKLLAGVYLPLFSKYNKSDSFKHQEQIVPGFHEFDMSKVFV